MCYATPKSKILSVKTLLPLNLVVLHISTVWWRESFSLEVCLKTSHYPRMVLRDLGSARSREIGNWGQAGVVACLFHQFHSIFSVLQASRSCQATRAKYIHETIMLHQNPIGRSEDGGYINRPSKALISMSNSTSLQYEHWDNLPPKAIIVAHNGVRTVVFRPSFYVLPPIVDKPSIKLMMIA